MKKGLVGAPGVSLGLLFLLSKAATAQTGNDFSPDIWGTLGAIVALIIVVVLAYWTTRFLAGRFGTSQAKHLKVAESLFLGPNRHLYLLLVNDKVLLLGGTEHGLSLIKEIDDPALYLELSASAQTAGQPLNGAKFSELFKQVLKGEAPQNFNAAALETKERLRSGLDKVRAWKKGRKQ